MAERRMFSKTIVDSDLFLNMPATSQLLYFHLEVQHGGGWLEICEVTGGRVIGSDEVKSDNCPFMEVKDYK